MATTTTALRRQISSAEDLKSVVRTMKASAASAIGQYERSVAALADYADTVELGLGVCLRSANPNGQQSQPSPIIADDEVIHVIVFGSDQGLVGSFNDAVVDHTMTELALLSAKTRSRTKFWTVGERAQARLLDAGIEPEGTFLVPGSIDLITRLVGKILLQVQISGIESVNETLILFYNRPHGSSYTPVSQRLLPLDEQWQNRLARRPWPTLQLPEALDTSEQTLRAFIREHLFVSLFRASAESLASENASRLAAMQRAERNIGDLLQDLNANFHQLRQAGIDEELFDVITGFDALLSDNNFS